MKNSSDHEVDGCDDEEMSVEKFGRRSEDLHLMNGDVKIVEVADMVQRSGCWCGGGRSVDMPTNSLDIDLGVARYEADNVET